MDDVTETNNRLWNTYSSRYSRKIADMPMSSETLEQDKSTLWNLLQQSVFPATPTGKLNPYHQRQFACCRVY